MDKNYKILIYFEDFVNFDFSRTTYNMKVLRIPDPYLPSVTILRVAK
jgi:hypothetical protein